METAKTQTQIKTTELVYIAIFAALMAICSWISIPSTVPFTMQTFAVFLALILLGGKRGTMAVLVYLLLGAVGAPVFAGFSGGIGILLGSTGGYLIGFLAQGLLYWLLVKQPVTNRWFEIAVLLAGSVVCYLFGTVWFVVVYTQNTGAIGFGTALAWCVTPYIIPGLIKLAMAVVLGNRLRRHVHL